MQAVRLRQGVCSSGHGGSSQPDTARTGDPGANGISKDQDGKHVMQAVLSRKSSRR